MINIDNSNRKGIYKDLYKAINTENKKNDTKVETFSGRIPKGIYKDIYKNIEKAKVVSAENNDIWHKYPLKLLVYSNDFGEAVRPVIGGFLAKLSWIPAILYTLLAVNSGEDKKDKTKELAFQAVASFLLPFLMLKSVRSAASKLIDKVPLNFKQKIKEKTSKIIFLDKVVNKFKKHNSSGYRNLALSTVGIASLSLGVRPIDKYVHNRMERYSKTKAAY